MRLTYVRFGDIPTVELSKNFFTDEYERGVSVYEALERDGNISILFPDLTGSACMSLSGVVDRPMYEIKGDKVGVGSDGEPLLKNCEIIREINNIPHARGW